MGRLMVVSIRAPRTGIDIAWFISEFITLRLNPCAPYGERFFHFVDQLPGVVFQSALPARGAMGSGSKLGRAAIGFQSALPARGAIGPHAAHAGARPRFNP